MEPWTLVRLAHVLAIAVFVGGQLVVGLAVLPMLRAPEQAPLRTAVARRFGMLGGGALVVLVGTGIAMAEHFRRWEDGVLQVKLALLLLTAVLVALHIRTPGARVPAMAVLAASLGVVWLGVALAH